MQYRILNICENTNLNWLEGFTEVNIVEINSADKTDRIDLIQEGIIEDKKSNNSGEDLIRYKHQNSSGDFEFGDIKSFVSHRPVLIDISERKIQGKQNKPTQYLETFLNILVIIMIIIGILSIIVFKTKKLNSVAEARKIKNIIELDI